MACKPAKKVKKVTIFVTLNGKPVGVTLRPPRGKFKAWYAYWPGCDNPRSTKEVERDAAAKAAEAMIQGTGRLPTVGEAVMTDEEFLAVQRRHYERRPDPGERRRSAKTLVELLDAYDAFKRITGLARVALASPDDCSRFQTDALAKPVDWRRKRAVTDATGATGGSRPRKPVGRRSPEDAEPPAGPRTVSRNTVPVR